jgi:uncharacterized protein (TIGR00369 family)
MPIIFLSGGEAPCPPCIRDPVRPARQASNPARMPRGILAPWGVVGMPFEPKNPQFETTVRRSFAQQGLMVSLGATMTRVSPGSVEIEIRSPDDLTQQHGYLHGGIVTAIADSACGYAALTLMPAGAEVLTVEYKVNFLAPAQGMRLVARGRVVRPGRTVSVCSGEVVAVSDGNEVPVAAMLATMIRSDKRLPGRPDAGTNHDPSTRASGRSP